MSIGSTGVRPGNLAGAPEEAPRESSPVADLASGVEAAARGALEDGPSPVEDAASGAGVGAASHRTRRKGLPTGKVLKDADLDEYRARIEDALSSFFARYLLAINEENAEHLLTGMQFETANLDRLGSFDGERGVSLPGSGPITTREGEIITLQMAADASDPIDKQELVNIAFFNALENRQSVQPFRDFPIAPQLEAVLNIHKLGTYVTLYRRPDAALILFAQKLSPAPPTGAVAGAGIAIDELPPPAEREVYCWKRGDDGVLIKVPTREERRPDAYSTRTEGWDAGIVLAAEMHKEPCTPRLEMLTQTLHQLEETRRDIEGRDYPDTARRAAQLAGLEEFRDAYPNFIEKQLELIP